MGFFFCCSTSSGHWEKLSRCHIASPVLSISYTDHCRSVASRMTSLRNNMAIISFQSKSLKWHSVRKLENSDWSEQIRKSSNRWLIQVKLSQDAPRASCEMHSWLARWAISDAFYCFPCFFFKLSWPVLVPSHVFRGIFDNSAQDWRCPVYIHLFFFVCFTDLLCLIRRDRELWWQCLQQRILVYMCERIFFYLPPPKRGEGCETSQQICRVCEEVFAFFHIPQHFYGRR